MHGIFKNCAFFPLQINPIRISFLLGNILEALKSFLTWLGDLKIDLTKSIWTTLVYLKGLLFYITIIILFSCIQTPT